MGKKTHIVSIMGNELTIAGQDDEEHVKKVAELVNGKMKEAQEKSRAVSTQSLALLTAMNIADEFLKYQEKTGRCIQKTLDALDSVKTKGE